MLPFLNQSQKWLYFYSHFIKQNWIHCLHWSVYHIVKFIYILWEVLQVFNFSNNYSEIFIPHFWFFIKATLKWEKVLLSLFNKNNTNFVALNYTSFYNDWRQFKMFTKKKAYGNGLVGLAASEIIKTACLLCVSRIVNKNLFSSSISDPY